MKKSIVSLFSILLFSSCSNSDPMVKELSIKLDFASVRRSGTIEVERSRYHFTPFERAQHLLSGGKAASDMAFEEGEPTLIPETSTYCYGLLIEWSDGTTPVNSCSTPSGEVVIRPRMIIGLSDLQATSEMVANNIRANLPVKIKVVGMAPRRSGRTCVSMTTGLFDLDRHFFPLRIIGELNNQTFTQTQERRDIRVLLSNSTRIERCDGPLFVNFKNPRWPTMLSSITPMAVTNGGPLDGAMQPIVIKFTTPINPTTATTNILEGSSTCSGNIQIVRAGNVDSCIPLTTLLSEDRKQLTLLANGSAGWPTGVGLKLWIGQNLKFASGESFSGYYANYDFSVGTTLAPGQSLTLNQSSFSDQASHTLLVTAGSCLQGKYIELSKVQGSGSEAYSCSVGGVSAPLSSVDTGEVFYCTGGSNWICQIQLLSGFATDETRIYSFRSKDSATAMTTLNSGTITWQRGGTNLSNLSFHQQSNDHIQVSLNCPVGNYLSLYDSSTDNNSAQDCIGLQCPPAGSVTCEILYTSILTANQTRLLYTKTATTLSGLAKASVTTTPYTRVFDASLAAVTELALLYPLTTDEANYGFATDPILRVSGGDITKDGLDVTLDIYTDPACSVDKRVASQKVITNGASYFDISIDTLSEAGLYKFFGRLQTADNSSDCSSSLTYASYYLGKWRSLLLQTTMDETSDVTAPYLYPGARSTVQSAIEVTSGGTLYNLVLYGGQNFNLGGALDDLWTIKYAPGPFNSATDITLDIAPTGMNSAPSYGGSPPSPGGRLGGVSWIDSTGDFWLFGGYRLGETHNDLWKLHNGIWSWEAGEASADSMGYDYGSWSVGMANIPTARHGAAWVKDVSGDLWMYGGQWGANANFLGELFKFNPSYGPTTPWILKSKPTAQLNGTGDANHPANRAYACMAADKNKNLWLFGGTGNGHFSDLWKYNGSYWELVHAGGGLNTYGTYGAKRLAGYNGGGQAITPGARYGCNLIYESRSNSLWLFGGSGYGASPYSGQLNDLWNFSIDFGFWTWVDGVGDTNIANIPANFVIGSRAYATGLEDPTHQLWIFGGSNGSGAYRDLWVWGLPNP